MLGADYKVWHDACHDGVRGGMSENFSGGMASNWGWEVYQGELAKIKRIIDHLPREVKATGMVIFAPNHAIERKHTKLVRNMLWTFFVSSYSTRIKSPEQSERALSLIDIAIEQAKYKHSNSGSNRYSVRDIATALECSPGTYQRDWQFVLHEYIRHITVLCDKALVPVREQIAQINKEYKKSA